MNRSTESRRCARRAGFTLMEILLVLAIIVVLASMVAPNFMNTKSGADIKAAKAEIRNLETAIESYRLDMGDYPPSLRELVEDPGLRKWRGPYLKGRAGVLPTDPWGDDYDYLVPGKENPSTYDVFSNGGPEGIQIGNWPDDEELATN